MYNEIVCQNLILIAGGDFITSPELGQIFGEMIAVWFLNEWSKIGSPKPFQIVELGPGKGTLMQDILRVFGHFDVLKNSSIHLVEVSPRFSALQAMKLCTSTEIVQEQNSGVYRKGVTKEGVPVNWYSQFEDTPKGFSLLVAHEFFDALPVHKFEKTSDGYREVLIDVTGDNMDEMDQKGMNKANNNVEKDIAINIQTKPNQVEMNQTYSNESKINETANQTINNQIRADQTLNNQTINNQIHADQTLNNQTLSTQSQSNKHTSSSQPYFRYVLSKNPTPASKVFLSSDEIRQHVEFSPQTLVICEEISKRIEEHGGLALIADYGHNGESKDSFRAFKKHKLHDPLVEPGMADLTADVDFAAVKKAMGKKDVLTFGPVTQRDFLLRMGIEHRVKKLLENCKEEYKEGLELSYRTITDEDKMGARFKFVCAVPGTVKEIVDKYPVVGFH